MNEQHAGHESNHEIRIHIDRQQKESPNPTSGDALYALGKVQHGHDLYREVHGDKEDELIHKNNEPVHLTADEHFYSAEAQKKEITIIENGRQKVTPKRKLSFADLVAFAFDPVATGPNILFTITFRHGPHANPEGTLVAGGTVKIKDGMIFNVTQTDKS
jgi:hypothetical protein